MAKKVLNQQPPISLLQEAQMVIARKWSYPSMQSFRPKEQVITTTFQHLFPTNSDPHEVYVKADLINQYYRTNIFAIKALSVGIVNANIDSDLHTGNTQAVENVAKALPVRKYYSFASKYCAMHRPDKYPINDRLVRGYLARVIAKGNISGYNGNITNQDLMLKNNYPYYKSVYDAFMEQYNLTSLSYRDVDTYLWIACKENLSMLDLFKLI